MAACMFDNFVSSEVTAEEGDAKKRPLREKNNRRGSKHVPHSEKPSQVVERRNARERRRVQAVNSAFVRLRKAVPVHNARGKRVSKVKTLQSAIEYIQALQRVLQEYGSYGAEEVYDTPIRYYGQCREEFFFDPIEY